MLWYAANLFIILIFVLLYFVIKRTDRRWNKVNDFLGKVANTVNSVRYGNLSTKIEDLDLKNYNNITESINRMIETLNDREKMVNEYQSELTRQNKFLEAVINSLSDGLLILDEDNKILRATLQIEKWFKENGQKLLGKNITDYILIPSELKPEKLKNTEIFIKNAPAATFEASAMKLVLEDKKHRYVMLIKDISSRIEVDKMKEDFVATLTDDLKVPILAESNILEFLLEEKFGAISEKQKEAISNMKRSNTELLDLVQILLDTYRAQNKGINLTKEQIDLKDLLLSVIDEMKPIAQKTGLRIKFKDFSAIKISADEIQLKRVFKNLIQNAISHSETTDIDVNVKIIPHFVLVNIKDYGIGISKENLKQIFNKYYSTAKKFRKIGTGLGLYLARQIVKSHGGEITAQSEEGSGTEFSVKLPM